MHHTKQEAFVLFSRNNYYYFFLKGNSNESFNLIGSLHGQYFPISAQGPR